MKSSDTQVQFLDAKDSQRIHKLSDMASPKNQLTLVLADTMFDNNKLTLSVIGSDAYTQKWSGTEAVDFFKLPPKHGDEPSNDQADEHFLAQN